MPVDIPLDHESDCDSSVDTNDAFMDMLGFSSHIPSTLDVDEDIEDTVCIQWADNWMKSWLV